MSTKRREAWLIAGLVATLFITGILALRAVNLGERAHSVAEPIRPWMSVPYIAHSRHVSQSTLWTALGLTPHAHDHRPIGRIAREQKRPVEDLISTLRATVEHAAKQHAPPATPKAAQ